MGQYVNLKVPRVRCTILLYSSPSPQNTSNTAPPVLLQCDYLTTTPPVAEKTCHRITYHAKGIAIFSVRRCLGRTTIPGWMDLLLRAGSNVNMVNKKNSDDTNLIVSCVTVSYPKWVVICNWSYNSMQMNANDGCHLTKMGECQYFMNLQFQ